jgi:hypothetical protein
MGQGFWPTKFEKLAAGKSHSTLATPSLVGTLL